MRLQATRAALCACASLLMLAAPSWSATAATLEQAVVVTEDAGRPTEVDFSKASSVTLPDNWRRSRPGFDGVAWYSIPLDGPLRAAGATGPEHELVLVVPRVADIGEFWLNGERLDLGTGNGFTRNRALWVPLGGHMLKPSGNLLQVRVSGSADTRGGLSRMSLGTTAAVGPAFQVRRFLQTIAPTMLMFAVPICLFGAIPLWFKTRRYIHLLFVLLCLSWMPRAVVMLTPEAGPPGPESLLFALVSTLVSNTLMIMLLLEYSHWTSPPWKRYLKVLYGVIALSFTAGVVAYLQGNMRPNVVAVLHCPYFALTIAVVLAQVHRAWRTRRRNEVFLAVTLVLWWAAVLQDLAIPADLNAFDSFFMAPVAALLVLATLVARTLEGLALHRASAEEEINLAVAGVSTAHGQALEEMRAEFDRRKAEERQAVIAAERTRLLHDLHDGMGSQLITALRMTRRDEVPREEVARVIEDSLEDMRLIIDSLDLEESDLLPLLANLRYRLEPRLNAIGVGLQWQVGPLPEMDYLTPETGLSILRTLQEAINNAVRHGAAKTITVSARDTASTLELSVTDDGCGFDTHAVPAPGKTQRGLAAMRMRAQKLAGQVRISSGTHGTCVTLELPLRR